MWSPTQPAASTPRLWRRRPARSVTGAQLFGAPAHQGRKTSLPTAALLVISESAIRDLEDSDVLQTHLSTENKHLDLRRTDRTDRSCGNAGLLCARDVGCLDHLFRSVCLSGRDSPDFVPSGPRQPTGIGKDRGTCEELGSRSLTPFACSLTSVALADETTAFGNANRGHKENQADDRANGAFLERQLGLSIPEHRNGCEWTPPS